MTLMWVLGLALCFLCVDGAALHKGRQKRSARCPQDNKDWRLHGDSCYAMRNRRYTYDEAMADCDKFGAVVAIINDEAEFSFLQNLTAELMAVQDKPYWIGADDRRTGQWMWADNSDIRFSAFAWGQPNSSFGHCLVVAASGKWRANDCATLRRFVCEKPAEPELVVDDNLAFSTTPPPSTDDDMVYWSTTPRPSTDDDMVYWSTTPRPSTDDADDIAETMLRFSLEALRRELRELLEELGQVTSKIDDVQQADIGNVFWQRPMA